MQNSAALVKHTLVFHSQLPAVGAAVSPILQKFKAPTLRFESKSGLNMLILVLHSFAVSVYFSSFKILFAHSSTLKYTLQSN